MGRAWLGTVLLATCSVNVRNVPRVTVVCCYSYLYCFVDMPLSCQHRRPGKRKLSGPLLRGNARVQRGRPFLCSGDFPCYSLFGCKGSSRSHLLCVLSRFAQSCLKDTTEEIFIVRPFVVKGILRTTMNILVVVRHPEVPDTDEPLHSLQYTGICQPYKRIFKAASGPHTRRTGIQWVPSQFYNDSLEGLLFRGLCTKAIQVLQQLRPEQRTRIRLGRSPCALPPTSDT